MEVFIRLRLTPCETQRLRASFISTMRMRAGTKQDHICTHRALASHRIPGHGPSELDPASEKQGAEVDGKPVSPGLAAPPGLPELGSEGAQRTVELVYELKAYIERCYKMGILLFCAHKGKWRFRPCYMACGHGTLFYTQIRVKVDEFYSRNMYNSS